MTQTTTNEAAAGRPADVADEDYRAHYLARTMRRLYSGAYSPSEIALVLCVCRRMRLVDGWYCAWPSFATVAKQCGCGVRTARRVLLRHAHGPRPLLALSRPAETAGHKHKSYRFSLVADVASFVAVRDVKQAEAADKARAVLQSHDFRRQLLELQRPLLEAGLTPADAARRAVAYERQVRKLARELGVRLPADVLWTLVSRRKRAAA